MPSIIESGTYTGGTYKRPKPMTVCRVTLDLTPDEAKAVREGRRGCSCDGSKLTRLGERCADIARKVDAKSWSIWPVIGSLCGIARVIVEFHNWPGMGLCNFDRPIGKTRYWWDEREQPKWLTGDVFGPGDDTGIFDPEA